MILQLKRFHWTLLFSAAGLLLFFFACKTKGEGAPKADFSFSQTTIHEGDTIRFINSTSNGSVFEWVMAPNGWKSTQRDVSYIFTEAGSYDITLTTKNGDGLVDSKTQTVVVLPDSIYRLSNNSKKVWTVRSIIYSGNELLTESCQKDDEFTVFRNAADTCTLTQGKDTCPTGTYIFELPATSQWRYNNKNAAFEFALNAFGSPINFSFAIKYLSRDSFYGVDANNSVSISLARKP